MIACYNSNKNHKDAINWQKQQQKLSLDISIIDVDVTDFSSCQNLIEKIKQKYNHFVKM